MFVYLQTCVAFSTHFCIWYSIHVFDKKPHIFGICHFQPRFLPA